MVLTTLSRHRWQIRRQSHDEICTQTGNCNQIIMTSKYKIQRYKMTQNTNEFQVSKHGGKNITKIVKSCTYIYERLQRQNQEQWLTCTVQKATNEYA